MTSLRLRAAVVALAGAVLAAGCSTASVEADDGSSSTWASGSAATAEPDAFPVTIEHAFGATTIEEQPTRVATLGWSDQDHVAALGVVPVGAVKITWGGNENGSSDWFDKAVADIGSEPPVRYDDADGAPIEEIAALAPDVILATNSGLDKEEYNRLSEIAPVVAYPEAPWVTPWQTSLGMVGRALGLSERAEQVEAETMDKIEEVRADHPEIIGKTLIFAYLTTADLSQIGIYAPKDPRVSFMHDLGLVDAPSIEGVIPEGEFYGQVSAERAPDLTSDVLLTWSENPEDMATFTADPLIGKVPAIASGHAYAEADTAVAYAVTNPNPLSIPVVIDEFVPHVVAAVAGQ